MPNGRQLTPEEQHLLAEKKEWVKVRAVAVVVAPWDQLASHTSALESAIAELKAVAGIE